MKHLFLARHSKSSHEIANITDIDRPLSQRGYDDAYKIADKITKMDIVPEIIFSSPAIRAFTTARIYADILNLKEDKLKLHPNIYFDEETFLIDLIPSLSNNTNNIMITGHNPGIHMLAENFTGKRYPKIPTSAVLCLQFKINSWQELNNTKAKLIYFEYPKKCN